jgi:hypothetical protein
MRLLPRNYHSHEHGTKSAPPGWVLFPAYTILPFLRAPLGYETLHPRASFLRTLRLIVLPLSFSWVRHSSAGFVLPTEFGFPWLLRFAVASFVLSFVRFLWRAFGPSRGEEVHSAEAGYSWLTWCTGLPMPLCELVIVPGLLAAVGYVVSCTASFELGWWLILCAASYLVMAVWEYRRRTAQKRATIDDKLRAQAFDEVLAGQERAARAPFWRRWRAGARVGAGVPDMAELGVHAASVPPVNASRESVIASYMQAGRAGFPWAKGNEGRS